MVVNREQLAAVLALKSELRDIVDEKLLSFDTLLSVNGLVYFREPEDDSKMQDAHNRDILEDFSLIAARFSEQIVLICEGAKT